MSAAVTVLVLVAVVFVVSVGLAATLDVYAAVILGGILAFGALALAITRRAQSGAIGPGRCHECDGVVSRSAPYCKHCGAGLGREGGPRTGGAPAGPDHDEV
jgi:hypothetical protein